MAKIKKVKKSSSASASKLSYDVTCISNITTIENAVILSVDNEVFTVRYRRPRTAKQDVIAIPAANVLYAQGSIGVEGAEVCFVSSSESFVVDGNQPSGRLGPLTVYTNADGETLWTNQNDNPHMRITAIASDVGGGDSKKAKKVKGKGDDADGGKKKLKKKKKKKSSGDEE